MTVAEPTSESAESQPAAIRVRKYPNRRLYCSDEKRFVTLEEIAGWVRSGKRVEVTDADSGKEITSEILTQILLEGGRARHFPVQLLEQMIRLNETTLKGFWEVYLTQSMHMFMGVQREMESFYQNLSPLLSAFSPLRAFQNPREKGSQEAPSSAAEAPAQDSSSKPRRRARTSEKKSR